MHIFYPAGQTPFQPTEVHLILTVEGIPYELHWPVAGLPFRQFVLQTATNFTDWVTLATLTNSGARFDYPFRESHTERTRFFRTAPQD